jgi:uncharacterized protein involved in type VI secretion and phage assembly
MSTRFSGVVVGVVTNVEDPEGRGRVEVRYPWLGSDETSTWASVVAPMAGHERGTFFMPEIDDEVLLAFEHGDSAHAYVIGFMWNGVHRPPSESVKQRIIRSKNGHCIRFLDTTERDGDMGALIIHDAHGNIIAMSNTRLVIKAAVQLELIAPQIIVRGEGWDRNILQNNNKI